MKKYLEIGLWIAFLGAAGYAIYTFFPRNEEADFDGSNIAPITPSPAPDDAMTWQMGIDKNMDLSGVMPVQPLRKVVEV